MKIPHLFGLHAEPRRGLRPLLAILPFLLIIIAYLVASDFRLAANPADKLLPSVATMAHAIDSVAFTRDKRTHKYLLWTDTQASLTRIGSGVLLAAFVGLLVGINMALFPGMRSLCQPVVTFLSIIPPLALLPMLFITFGIDEVAKIVLIFIGTVGMITRDMTLATAKIPREQIVKALTLGASEFAVVYRIVLPQVFPRLIDAVRLSLGAAWLFLIAAEAIAATDGLGYRIFLVRRYLSMEIIIPYVLWITFLGFSLDWCLRKLTEWRFAWYVRTAE